MENYDNNKIYYRKKIEKYFSKIFYIINTGFDDMTY
jgi:hypothetical protein